MPENYQIALLSGGLTLIGVTLGSFIPFIIEVCKRKWLISDRQYERKKEVLDRRCDQAEEYAQAATADFRRVMHDAESSFLDENTNRVIERVENQRESKDNLDTKIFSLGPSIRALGDKELKDAWDSMMRTREKLNAAYLKSVMYRFQSDKSIEPILEHKAIQEIWIEYTRYFGNFYKSLDRIRNISL